MPQGSVLGPLLWNITYDKILNVEIPDDCYIICYTDDTLLVAITDNVSEAVACVELTTARLAREIEEIGLKLAAKKTEAIVFMPRRVPRPLRVLVVQRELIKMADTIEYLGLHIDSKWTFIHGQGKDKY